MDITLTLTEEQAHAVRSIGAKINGAIGGRARSIKKIRSCRRNVKKAVKAIKQAGKMLASR